MFCPQCGQERLSEATSFCSRCGFLLTGTTELLQTGGELPASPSGTISPRSRGIRMGLFLFLLMIIIAPIIGIVSTFLFRITPWPMGVVLFLLGGAGLLRMAYAIMFESKYAENQLPISPVSDRQVTAKGEPGALPPQQTYPAGATPQMGRWLDTRELEPGSVTENTTKLLEKEVEPPK
jgi:hypothetical protein